MVLTCLVSLVYVLQPSTYSWIVDLLVSGDWKLSATVSSSVEAAIASEQDTLEKVTGATASLLRSIRIPVN